jgi:hypothetical protein
MQNYKIRKQKIIMKVLLLLILIGIVIFAIFVFLSLNRNNEIKEIYIHQTKIDTIYKNIIEEKIKYINRIDTILLMEDSVVEEKITENLKDVAKEIDVKYNDTIREKLVLIATEKAKYLQNENYMLTDIIEQKDSIISIYENNNDDCEKHKNIYKYSSIILTAISIICIITK